MNPPFNPNTASFFAILKRTYVCAFSDWTTRATRREYWLGYLGSLLLISILYVLIALIGAPLIDDNESLSLFRAVVLVLTPALVGLPIRCLQVRRLHDIGCSGLWVIALVITMLVPIVSVAGEVIIGCIDSQPGKNTWGISPKHRDGLPPVPSVADILPTVRMKRTKAVSPPRPHPRFYSMKRDNY